MKKSLSWLLLVGSLAAQTFNQNVVPTTTGLDLGRNNQRWDAFIRNLDINGTCSFNGTPIACFGGGGGGSSINGVLTGAGSGLQGGGVTGILNLSLLTTCSSGQILRWNGSTWACATLTGSPAGVNGQLQINNSGSFGALGALGADYLVTSTAANTFSTQQINSGSSCGDATHAISYDVSTHKFGCQAITGSATAGGSSGQLQWNNATALGGISGWTTNGTTTVTGGTSSIFDLSGMSTANILFPNMITSFPVFSSSTGSIKTDTVFANAELIPGADSCIKMNTGNGTAVNGVRGLDLIDWSGINSVAKTCSVNPFPSNAGGRDWFAAAQYNAQVPWQILGNSVNAIGISPAGGTIVQAQSNFNGSATACTTGMTASTAIDACGILIHGSLAGGIKKTFGTLFQNMRADCNAVDGVSGITNPGGNEQTNFLGISARNCPVANGINGMGTVSSQNGGYNFDFNFTYPTAASATATSATITSISAAQIGTSGVGVATVTYSGISGLAVAPYKHVNISGISNSEFNGDFQVCSYAEENSVATKCQNPTTSTFTYKFPWNGNATGGSGGSVNIYPWNILLTPQAGMHPWEMGTYTGISGSANLIPIGAELSGAGPVLRSVHCESHTTCISIGDILPTYGVEVKNAFLETGVTNGVHISAHYANNSGAAGTTNSIFLQNIYSGGGSGTATTNTIVDDINSNTLTTATNPLVPFYVLDRAHYPSFIIANCTEVTNGICFDNGIQYFRSSGATKISFTGSSGTLTSSFLSLQGSTSGSTTLSASATGGTLNLGSINATVSATGIINSTSGYQYGGTAPLNHCLIGNGSVYVDSASCGGGSGGGSLDTITGSAAVATATETGAGRSWTYAGIETGNFTAPIAIKNSNSTNNNTSVGLIAGAEGTSTGGIGLLAYNNTGTDIQRWYSGGSVTSGVYTPGTLQGTINSSGNLIMTGGIGTGGATVPATGVVALPAISAPTTPAAGFLNIYEDSTDLRLHDKNASGTIGTTVVADTGTAKNFLTAISAAGAISKAQPAISDLTATFSSPLSLSTNTLSCPTCVVSTSPGAGIAHFAGSTQTVTSSAIVDSDISGQIGNSHGGTGQNSSASTGVAQVSSGTWSFSTALANGTTATTQAAFSADTKVATDAYADASGVSTKNAQTTTYQVLAADFSQHKTITVASGTFTITLVASGSQPANGQWLNIINYGTGVVTVARSGQNINGGTTSLTIPAAPDAQHPFASRIMSDGTDYFASTAFPATTTTGTGNVVLAASPTITGHATIEGVTATGATGTGKFVFDTAPSFTTSITAPTYLTTTKCAAAGSAANPSAVACSAAPSGSFSCATNASTGTCVVSTTAVTASSAIFVQPDSSLGTLLSVTCNTTADTGLTAPRVSARTAGTSFTITLGTFTTNPLCYSYMIVN